MSNFVTIDTQATSSIPTRMMKSSAICGKQIVPLERFAFIAAITTL